MLCSFYDAGEISYNKVYNCLEGWCAYAKTADSFKIKGMILHPLREKFKEEIPYKEINCCLKLFTSP